MIIFFSRPRRSQNIFSVIQENYSYYYNKWNNKGLQISKVLNLFNFIERKEREFFFYNLNITNETTITKSINMQYI